LSTDVGIFIIEHTTKGASLKITSQSCTN